MRTFSVKNFERFQHYTDRTPPWIKLYNSLLDDYDFGRLQDASKLHLIAIWLLASRSDNKIPYDPAWVARRINANSHVDLDGLLKSGFIQLNEALPHTEQDASAPLAECLPRERVETEGETDRRAPRKTRGLTPEKMAQFDAWYAIYPLHKARAPAEQAFVKSLSIASVETLMTGARRYAEACRGRDPDKIAHPATWLNQRRWEDEPAKPSTGAALPIMGRERSPVVWRNRLAQWLSGASWLASWDISDCPLELLTEFAARLKAKPPPGFRGDR